METQYEDLNIEEDKSATNNIYTQILKTIPPTKNFILRNYQVIPKYYLLNHSRVLIIHYSPGSGKSAAAIFTATHFLNQIQKNKFLNKPDQNKKILVVGAWTTQNAFLEELVRPEFHLTTVSEINSINEKLNSSFKEVVEEGRLMRNKLDKRISSNFIFKNLQGVFNMAFPDLDQQKFVQDVKSLIYGWKTGELQIDTQFLETIRNSFVVVDECQRLWNTTGMNTYGFVIGALIKKAREYNIHFMFLTGTMINNNICELATIASVLDLDGFLNEEEFVEQKELFNGIKVNTLKKNKVEDLVTKIQSNFLYYNQKSTKEGFKIEKIPDFEYSPDVSKLIIEPVDTSLPIENHIGNIQFDNMNILALDVRGYQKLKYMEYIKGVNLSDITQINTSEEDYGSENSDDTINSYHDGIFDPKDPSLHFSNGIYKGIGLQVEHLENYSIIASFFVKLCISNTLKGEKTVGYHDKILGFGIKQYKEILNENGFIEYGTIPTNNTKCKICGVELASHNNKDHTFIPMRYIAFYGDVSESDRMTLKKLYNQPNNLYGDICSVLLISSVAFSGVSFLNTNNMVILNKISNISKWRQIYARIVRSHGHDLLSKDKHFVNVYTTIIRAPNDQHYEEMYYKVRSKLNLEVENLTEQIYHKSITDILFKTPEKLPEDFRNIEEKKMFKNDLEREIELVFNNLNLNKTLPWFKEALLLRIKDTLKPVSFIDFNTISDEDIFNLIVQKNLIKLFKYQTISNKLFCIPELINDRSIDYAFTSFKFNDLKIINIKSESVKNVLEKLFSIVKAKDDVMCRNLLNKLLKTTNYRIDKYADQEIFWQAIYLIGDEYYDDDPTNFIKNHSKEGRDYKKVTGCYINNKVIKRNGEVIMLNKKLVPDKILSDIPMSFGILSFSTSESLTWYLRVIILKKNEVDDVRKQNKGLSCFSFDIDKISNYFTNLNKDEVRRHYCTMLLSELCSHVIEKHDEDKLVHPFSD